MLSITFSKVVQWPELGSLPGQFLPSGLMFDSPCFNHTHAFTQTWKKENIKHDISLMSFWPTPTVDMKFHICVNLDPVWLCLTDIFDPVVVLATNKYHQNHILPQWHSHKVKTIVKRVGSSICYTSSSIKIWPKLWFWQRDHSHYQERCCGSGDCLTVLFKAMTLARWPQAFDQLPFSHRYSVVVEGERGNRPHIYCLEQLLQEAVSIYVKYVRCKE